MQDEKEEKKLSPVVLVQEVKSYFKDQISYVNCPTLPDFQVLFLIYLISHSCNPSFKKINFNPILTPAKNEITRKFFFLGLKILCMFLVILNLCLISVLRRMLDVNKNRSAESLSISR